MLPFFPERSQGPVTSLPEQDNALPKWWKEILPRLELNEVVVRAEERGRRFTLNGGKMLVTRCSLAGAITHLKRDCVRLLLCLYGIYSVIHSSNLYLSAGCPLCHPQQTLQLAQRKKADLSVASHYVLGQGTAILEDNNFYNYFFSPSLATFKDYSLVEQMVKCSCILNFV